MVRNDIKNSSLLKTKFLIYAFNGRTLFFAPNNPLLAPKKPLFNDNFALFSHVFHGSKGFYLYHSNVFLCFSPCI